MTFCHDQLTGQVSTKANANLIRLTDSTRVRTTPADRMRKHMAAEIGRAQQYEMTDAVLRPHPSPAANAAAINRAGKHLKQLSPPKFLFCCRAASAAA